MVRSSRNTILCPHSEQLSQELEELFNNNTDLVETLLSFALEMLAPDNACSDILSRIPVCGHRSVRRVSRGSVAGVRVMISGDQETRRGVDQSARLRLLHTSGYTPQNIGAVLLGLCGHEPVVETSDTAQVRGWTRILEHKPSLFSSLSLLWSSSLSCSMSQLNLGKLFENISRSSIRNILIDLTFTLGKITSWTPCPTLWRVSASRYQMVSLCSPS